MAIKPFFPVSFLNIQIGEDVIVATITNRTNVPIVCSGEVFGQTEEGFVHSHISDVEIIPGRYEYFYISTSEVFVDGDADVKCRANRAFWQ
jgi:hypothetical protein